MTEQTFRNAIRGTTALKLLWNVRPEKHTNTLLDITCHVRLICLVFDIHNVILNIIAFQ